MEDYNMRYYIIFDIISIVIVVFILIGIKSDEEKIKETFEKNKTEFTMVADYLSKAEVDPYITKEKIKLPTFIENDEITSIIKFLFEKKHVINIVKSEKNIYFLMKSGLDIGKGIVYSFDEELPKLQFLTKLIPLDEPQWFYYEEDFNQWRIEHKKLQESAQ